MDSKLSKQDQQAYLSALIHVILARSTEKDPSIKKLQLTSLRSLRYKMLSENNELIVTP